MDGSFLIWEFPNIGVERWEFPPTSRVLPSLNSSLVRLSPVGAERFDSFDGLVPNVPAAATSRAAVMVFEWKLYTTMPLDDCFGLIVLFGLVRRVVHHRWHRKLWYQRGVHDASGNVDDDHHHRV